jgi:hypothetical protein
MSWTGFNWTADHPRRVVDLTGDGRADVVGFAPDGVWVARNNGDGTFSPPTRVVAGFGTDGGWHVARHVRVMADLTGDGRPDIVGFGDRYVWTALNNGDGTFQAPQPVLEAFTPDAGSWQVDRHPRALADLTGDGRADIVGFGDDYVWVALGNGDGSFQAPAAVLDGFSYNQGWRVDQHPRLLAELNGDGRADIVGFGNDGVYAALGDGAGGFGLAAGIAGFGRDQGWRPDRHPRMLADLNGDGRADIVGFGDAGVYVALGDGVGGFQLGEGQAEFGFDEGWRVDRHPRMAGDITGDGRADLVGFGDVYVLTALGNGVGGFRTPGVGAAGFGANQGWTPLGHPRQLADLTGDGRADIVGFGDYGVWTALSRGDGTFETAVLALQDFGARSGDTGVRHVFVLMLENRSFDHLLGFSGITGTDAQSGAPTSIDGLTGTESNDFHGVTFHVSPTAPNRMRHDPGHSFDACLVQLCGYGVEYPPGGPYPPSDNSGFATSYGLGEDRDPADALRCCGENQLPYLHQLAREFVVCDHWYCSHPGHTWPNRFFVHAATSGGMDMDPDALDKIRWETVWGDGLELANGTIYDRLRAADVAYRLYKDAEPLIYMPPMVSALKNVSIWDIDSLDELASDLADDDFRDVRYIHIEPSYDALSGYEDGNSQHPLGDVRRGDELIKDVYETIRNSPVWEHSLLIITWDEHGGFYDHVKPPAAMPPGDVQADEIVNHHQFAFDQLGPRVPALIISPLIPKNLIDHRTYDHTSVLATAERLLGLNPLTERDRHANSLHTLIQLPEARTDTPARLRTPAGHQAPPRAKKARTRPSRPDASIDEGQIAGFVYAAFTQDIEISPPDQQPAIRARVAGIRTHQQAFDYIRDVGARVAVARQRRPARIAS